MASGENSSFVNPAPSQPRLPDAGVNNVWYQDRATDATLIFVHGIFSDSRSCWLREGPPLVYWPDLVSRDRRFDRYSLYLGGYYTALDAGPFKVQHCADELFRALGRPDRPDAQGVLQRATLVFVCHSTGGIIVRYLLESRAAEFKDKTVGLVLIASPSFGSGWATKLSWLSEFYNAQLVRQLEWGNNSLDDLDERFQRLIKERRIPHLLGAEAYENHFVFHRKLLPDRLVVVDKNSAGRYFAPAHLLANTDHFTSAKPDSERHPAHELLVDFCSELERYQRNQPAAIAARGPTNTRAEQREKANVDVGPALRDSELHCIVVPATLVEGSFFAASLTTLDLTLVMRETDQRVAVKTPPNIEIRRIARFLAASLLPNLLHRGYEWTIEHNSRELPSHHTLYTCGVRTGDVIHLAGSHRKPKVRPFEG